MALRGVLEHCGAAAVTFSGTGVTNCVNPGPLRQAFRKNEEIQQVVAGGKTEKGKCRGKRRGARAKASGTESLNGEDERAVPGNSPVLPVNRWPAVPVRLV